MKKYYILFFALLLIAAACSDKKQAEKAQTQKPVNTASSDKALKIKAANVEARTIERRVEIVGTLAAWEEVTVSNESAGTVEKIFFDLGDTVKQGQPMLKLDSREPLASLQSQEENLKTNEKNYERVLALKNDAYTNLKRYEALFAEEVISKKDMDSAKTQYDVQDASLKQAEAMISQARAQVQIAKKRLQDMEIFSPIGGEVKKRFVSVGEAVKDKTPLFIIVKNDPIKLKALVPEQFVGHIRLGQSVFVKTDAFPDKVFTGNIVRLSPAVDEKTRTMDIEIKIPNPKKELKSGLFAKGYIITKKERDIPFVPEEAVYSFLGINKVYIVKDNKAHDRPVKTGLREAGFVEVIEGVKVGDVVASTSLDQLFEGAKVETK